MKKRYEMMQDLKERVTEKLKESMKNERKRKEVYKKLII